MENPLKQDASESYIERITEYAKDMAWTVINELSDERLANRRAKQIDGVWTQILEPDSLDKEQAELFEQKWGDRRPSIASLETFNYIRRLSKDYHSLTVRSFALLEQPSKAPKVFISYSRDHSTTFALYIEARLRVAGNSNVFVDRSLEPGSLWRDTLKAQIDECAYFVVILDEGVFNKRWVRQEIEWAIAAGCKIIPVVHDYEEEIVDSRAIRKRGMRKRDIPEQLAEYQPIQAYDKTAKGYEAAMNELLNLLGYATY